MRSLFEFISLKNKKSGHTDHFSRLISIKNQIGETILDNEINLLRF